MLSNANLPSHADKASDVVMTLKPTSACCAAMGATASKPEFREFVDQSAGSRRQRLWELRSGAHCPVIGVCIAVASLRRIATKLLVGAAARDDYQLHCEAIAHSRRPSPMAEALQNALDRRYPTALRKTAALKTTEALATWWQLSSCATTLKPARQHASTPARPSLKVAWI